METQEQRVFNYMKQHGGITRLEMFDNFYICGPQSVIRNLRHKYNILDEWRQIEKKYIDEQGKEQHGGITSLEMFDNFYICGPQSVIRNLRHKYNILDEWRQIEKKYIDEQGKEKKKSIRFKRWFFGEERA